MKILQEFKEFAVKGNVIDLAVGVIIGGAFGKIVTSLVNDIIMPPVGVLLGNVDFKDLKIPIGDAPDMTDGTIVVQPAIYYGSFINTILDFLIVALCIFFMVKGINHLRRITEKEKVADVTAPTEKECPHCLSQVPIKATRCKHCTSHLVNSTINE
ncbi:large-conductance mechanosensitive channel protein MscL [Paenibacillus endoradicis]|uniref:large-conductance mechanosensitive channel protein MscL n=1 Tax=Paenibacillus endoradicis TaxID=2972487 RepID=UPI002158C8B0|nr:large-conductance mechanosensitive channel protein MscL [Paenibacillus endoradicis]MCR8660007.1 large-conductance mechanosensitive channel protein MscL [Paenibacillus endoradicis]